MSAPLNETTPLTLGEQARNAFKSAAACMAVGGILVSALFSENARGLLRSCASEWDHGIIAPPPENNQN